MQAVPFDQEYFILCVEEERIIWDCTLDSYASKTSRLQAWTRIFVRMERRGYKGTIEDLKKMWRSIVSKYRRFKQSRSGSEAVHNPLMDKLTFLDSTLIPQESTRYSNFDSLSDRNLDSTITEAGSSQEPSIPVLGDRTNSVSSSLSLRRKRRLEGEESNAVMAAAEAVRDRLDRMRGEDRYTWIGYFVVDTLRRLTDAEADRLIYGIMGLCLRMGPNYDAENNYERNLQNSGVG
ncbi:unnamed protein product [Cylicocyclus nassatus]|uniref:MADF domain-containing protein n=1 Tax=Cylicocyclus nassatus TaxID=53992 RepID=A0AA36M955_CYLNA|nr:unnamed protein product [Cylicocyclus nassatus]